MEPVFFDGQAAFHDWLMQNQTTATELLLGFYKKGAGISGITYAEALDEALCFGWIDGVRRRIDDERFTIRFTPRKPRSIWSAVNTKRATELAALGLMQERGLATFTGRDPSKANLYSYENSPRGLDDRYTQLFIAQEAAWRFFQSQAPSYQRTASWWVMSAKHETTRQKRLARLIDDSAHGRKIASLSYGNAANPPQSPE